MDDGERHIEMTWRCSTCQTQNLGRFKTCQSCGHPKDESEQYEMPADPANAASVTEADLLRMATAGPDWRCAYCGSDQRRSDNTCAQCGASIGAATEVPDPPQAAVAPPKSRRKLVRNIALASGVTAALAGGLVWNARRPRDYDAKVTAVSWEHKIDVERYKIHDREGFKETIPAAALEVTSVGQKVHHHDQVLDHYETEHYTVQVPDGYRTESYSARESCGQDCTTKPQSCRQSCTSKKNGFASCRNVCSGGGRSCTTRYCNVSKTRQVPRTRSEGRTRQVAKYRQEPRYAEAFAYKLWQWAPERSDKVDGTSASLTWPMGARLVGLPTGEQEREVRSAKYIVKLQYDDDASVKFEVLSAEQFVKFAPGTSHEVHREPDVILVDGAPIKPIE
ncbi:MAG: hypothetical protein ABI867_35450 [Kofleriaceae bacterium]